jgi:GNAT superfamily N-acetyltransferase
MITYRTAHPADAAAIATLHAQSWQRHYRGIWADAFLDGPVVENRQTLWQQRLQNPAHNQHLILAENEGRLVGFVCVFAKEHETFGALIDNLHVISELKGKGIGRELLRRAAAWVYAHDGNSPIYLWVLVKNEGAKQFYDRMNGENYEMAGVANPDGSYSDCYRYVWWKPAQLSESGFTEL